MPSKSIIVFAALTGIALSSPTAFKPTDLGPEQGQHPKYARQEVEVADHCGPTIFANTYSIHNHEYTPRDSDDDVTVSQSITFFDPEEFHAFDDIKYCKLIHYWAPVIGFEGDWTYQYFSLEDGRPSSPPADDVEFHGNAEFEDDFSITFESDLTVTLVKCADLKDWATFQMHRNIGAVSISALALCGPKDKS